MPEENLTLRMRERGARAVKRALEGIGKEVKEVDRSITRATSDVGIFSKALTFMRVRAIVGATILVSLASVLYVTLVPAIVLTTASLLSLGAVLGATMLIARGAMQRFADGSTVAGTAASQLRDHLAHLKHAWDVAISPAAAILMRGLAMAIIPLIPLIESLRGPLASFARHLSLAIQTAARSLSRLGPQFAVLLKATEPVLERLALAVEPITRALIALAIAGTPILLRLIDKLTEFAWSVERAALEGNLIPRMLDRWEASWRVITGVTGWLIAVLSDLVTIVVSVVDEMKPLLATSVEAFFEGFARSVDWVADNMDTLAPIIAPVVTGLIALKFAALGAAFGMRMFNFALKANPLVLLAIGLLTLYQHNEDFRRSVNSLKPELETALGVMKSIWNWVMANFVNPDTRWEGLESLTTSVNTLKDAWKGVRDMANGAADAVTDAWNATQGVRNFIGDVGDVMGAPFGAVEDFLSGGFGTWGGKADNPLSGPTRGGKALGGPVLRSGPYDVGERGKERVWLPAGSMVEPHGGFATPGEFVIDATFILPSGEVLARQTVRAARKKRSHR